MQSFKDEGLVIKKTRFGESNLFVTIISQEKGKLVLKGYGVKKSTSKRLSHLETGNYVRFSYLKKDDRLILGETELMYAHSKIKKSPAKIEQLFLICFVLNKILPEGVEERVILKRVLKFLQFLNNSSTFSHRDLEQVLKDILILAGFLTRERAQLQSLNPFYVLEELLGETLSKRFDLLS